MAHAEECGADAVRQVACDIVALQNDHSCNATKSLLLWSARGYLSDSEEPTS